MSCLRSRLMRYVVSVGLTAAAAMPGAALAGDVTVFATLPSPSETWNRGFGAALASTWFNVLTFEGEAARMPGDLADRGLTSFTASALLSPPIGGLIPYGGLGVGVFRQTLGERSDTGTLSALVLGLKVRIKNLIVIRGDYRRLQLSGEPLLAMDSRVSFGAGIAF